MIDANFEGEYDDSPFDPTWMSIQEVTELLGVTRQTLYNWRKQGTLPAYRIGTGRAVRYKRSDVEQLCAYARSPRRIDNE